MSSRLIALGLVVCVCRIGFSNDAWSSFQNGGQNSVDAKRVPLKWGASTNIRWKAKLTGYGQSTPVVWQGSIYVTCCLGKEKETMLLRSYDLKTGDLKWEHRVRNSSPEKNSNYVSRSAPTPVADKTGVFAFFEGGNLIALDHSGKSRWSRDLVADYGPVKARHGLAASLEQSDDTIFVWVERSAEPYVLAVDKSTGKTKWKVAGVGATSWASPRLIPVGKSSHLVLSAGGKIIGLDPKDGRKLWTFSDITSNNTPTPVPVGDGSFLIGASVGRGATAGGNSKSNGIIQIAAADDGTFKAGYRWKAAKATSSFGSPVLANGYAYFVNRAGALYCLDAKTGKQQFATRTASSVWATPVQVGDRLYLFGKNGTTSVVKTGSKFELLARNELWKEAAPAGGQQAPVGGGGPVLYSGVIVDGCILIRTGSELFCIADQN